MKILAIIDNKIDKDEALALLDDYGDFYKTKFDIDASFLVERKDFSSVPTQPDAQGDLKPTEAYRKALETDVHNRYGDYGVDRILMWVHEDNFLYKGVWGTAWAYNFFKYSFELCRWDKKNDTNTFNTLFHEGAHPVDTLIKKELNIDINPIIKDWILKNGSQTDKNYVMNVGFNWDRDFVHGALPSAPYIGERGYTRSDKDIAIMKVIAPQMKQAYLERQKKHTQKKVISALQRYINILLKRKQK